MTRIIGSLEVGHFADTTALLFIRDAKEGPGGSLRAHNLASKEDVLEFLTENGVSLDPTETSRLKAGESFSKRCSISEECYQKYFA